VRYEDVIGQFAGRQAGSPTTPSVPGGSPTASQPPGSPNPPGLNSAMPGRKPDTPPPMGGMPIPQQANVSQPTGREATQEQSANLDQQKNTEQARPTLLLNRIPAPGEMYGMPPGIQVRTPYGDLDEEGNIAKSPEYEQKHKEAIVRARQKFGPHPWNGMAGAPEPEIALGKSFFNPFTRNFGRAE
jgi:hypothetical protein